MSQSPLQGKTYYEILGIVRTATPEEVETAFRRLARKWHPDVCEDTQEAAATFKLIIEAYEVLADPEKRRHYDRAEARGRRRASAPGFRPRPARKHEFADVGGGWGPRGALEEFHELCDSLFGGRTHPGVGRGLHPELDIESELPVSPEEARHGAVVQVKVRFEEDCPACEGKGVDERRACGDCQGSGKVPRGPRFVRVRVPARARDGSVVRVSGEGRHAADGSASGDLILRVRIQPVW